MHRPGAYDKEAKCNNYQCMYLKKYMCNATSSEDGIKADGRFTGMYNITMNLISDTAPCEE